MKKLIRTWADAGWTSIGISMFFLFGIIVKYISGGENDFYFTFLFIGFLLVGIIQLVIKWRLDKK